jgi:hypothetical protein
MNSKVCSSCNENKLFEDFNKSSRRKDGRREKCRSCEKKHRDTPEIKKQRYSRDLKNKYNLTVEEYVQMFGSQEGSCAICKGHQSLFKRPLVVDHNHTTGRVRGLLCDNCNRCLGLLKDNKELLTNAINYLSKHDG